MSTQEAEAPQAGAPQVEEVSEASATTTQKGAAASQPAKKPPKFIYNCVRCGHYCRQVEGVPVTLADLRNWQAQEMMMTIMPHLELLTDSAGNPRLVLAPTGGFGEADIFSGLDDLGGAAMKGGGLLGRLRKRKAREEGSEASGEASDGASGEASGEEGQTGTEAETEEAVQKSGCPFHDGENKLCQIYHALPTSCAAYPLGYNGSKYFVTDKACQGLGAGQMNAESLRAIRDAARTDFEARTETGQLLTTLYGLFMGQMAAQSAKVMGSLDPEKLKQLGELLGQAPPEGDP